MSGIFNYDIYKAANIIGCLEKLVQSCENNIAIYERYIEWNEGE